MTRITAKLRVSKYRAVPTVVDGVRFASKREAARYQELKLLERAGKIEDLELQPEFAIHVPIMTGTVKGAVKSVPVRSVPVAVYRADFAYVDWYSGGRVVEDVKGVRTPVYRLKKKLVEAQYGVRIHEV